MKTSHQIEHDHEAIRAMLATHAADDTSWDQPPMLFALVHDPDPDTGYGVVPVRPLNAVLHEHMNDGHRLPAVLATIADHVHVIENLEPGLDTLRNAVLVCRGEPEMARQWFPRVSKHTIACGLVLRTETWTLQRTNLDDPYPEGSWANHPDSIESLSWQAVVDDDMFDHVAWDRGDGAPWSDHWSFQSDFYKSAKHKQRVPTLMRAIVRLSARTSFTPWPPPEVPSMFKRP